jgi:hypothetical protein
MKRIIIIALMVCCAATAFAAKPVDRSDKVPHRYPMVAMGLSAICPGGGQLYTQKYYRAAGFAAAIGYLGYHWYDEKRQADNITDAYYRTFDTEQRIQLNTDWQRHNDRQRTYQLWTIGIWLFSLADAYVDAHMFRFDDRADPRITLQATPSSLALCAKF